MKILLVNKFYFLKGGSETVLFDQKRMLEAAGYEVVVFSMHDPRNIKTRDSKYFVSAVDFSGKGGLFKKFKSGLRFIWSREAKKKMAALIAAEKPDIAHVHNLMHQLTPSILQPLKKAGIPIVQTIHDYQIVSPNYRLMTKTGLCRGRKDFRWYHIFFPPCPLKTYSRSVLSGLEFYLHRLLKTYPEPIDLLATPSVFMRQMLKASGIDKPIEVVHNTIPVERIKPHYDVGAYALAVGRLSEEKGIMTLLRAVEKVPDMPIKIIGDGPLLKKVKEFIVKKRLHNIELLGRQDKSFVYAAMRDCRFFILPSEWYENYPMVVLEALAHGKPVLGSNIGGIPELVIPGRTGWLFTPGDKTELRQKLREIWGNTEEIMQFGRLGRKQVEIHNKEAVGLKKLTALYNNLLHNNGGLG